MSESWPMITNLEDLRSDDLRPLISKLVCIEMRRPMPQYSWRGLRPPWWPKHLPWEPIHKDTRVSTKRGCSWTEELRGIVRQCYHYHGREDLIIKTERETHRYNFRTLTPVKTDNTKPRSKSEHPVIRGGMRNSKLGYVQIYVCFYCDKDFIGREDMARHHMRCENSPDYDPNYIPSPPPTPVSYRFPTIKVNLNTSLHHQRPKKTDFISGLGLISKENVEEVLSQNKVAKDRALDYDYPDVSMTPIKIRTPCTPQTPRLLDQLLTPQSHRKKFFSNDEDDDVRSVTSDRSDGSEALLKTKSLLNIDLCSTLGQKVRRHIDVTEASLVTNIDRYCHTPIKNTFLEKLRGRKEAYPYVFRRTRNMGSYVHTYKFTKRQRKEFLKRMRTGLNKKSRHLRRSLRSCHVKVKRLTSKTICQWMTGHKVPVVSIKHLAANTIIKWTTPKKNAEIQPRIQHLSPCVLQSPCIYTLLNETHSLYVPLEDQSQSNHSPKQVSPTKRNMLHRSLLPEFESSANKASPKVFVEALKVKTPVVNIMPLLSSEPRSKSMSPCSILKRFSPDRTHTVHGNTNKCSNLVQSLYIEKQSSGPFRDAHFEPNNSPVLSSTELANRPVARVRPSFVVPQMKPAILRRKPSIPEEKSAMPQEKPVMSQEKPAMPQEKSAILRKRPAILRKAVLQKKTSVSQEKSSVPQEKPAILQEMPALPQGKPEESNTMKHSFARPEESVKSLTESTSLSNGCDVKPSSLVNWEKLLSDTFGEIAKGIKKEPQFSACSDTTAEKSYSDFNDNVEIVKEIKKEFPTCTDTTVRRKTRQLSAKRSATDYRQTSVPNEPTDVKTKRHRSDRKRKCKAFI